MEGAEGVKGLRGSFISLNVWDGQEMGKADVECSEDRWSETANDIWLCHGMR
jgi:hypothetical protein